MYIVHIDFLLEYGEMYLFLADSAILNESPDTATILLIIIAGVIVFGGLGALLVTKFNKFKRRLDYFNMEIGRSHGDERKHWKKKRRRLWLSLLPFTKKH